MPRRLPAIPSVPRVRSAGSWLPQIGFRKMGRPPSPPIHAYTVVSTAPIGGYGVAQTVISAGGGGRISIGPSGLGTTWYPQQVSISTTTGALDTSTAVGYLGPSAVPSAIQFTAAGGGSTVGLAVPLLQPGDLLTVIWSGGHPGDIATVIIVGTQTTLASA